MVNIAICDDDKILVDKTRKMIMEYDNVSTNIDIFYSGEELLKNYSKFDLIFLDIDMNGINGIDTAKKIREFDKNVKIIYVTSYTDYTYSAFSVHAFNYLIKPLEKEKLFEQLNEALSYNDTTVEEETVIEFITTDGVLRINTNDIYYFEYSLRKVIMHTTEGAYNLKQKISDIIEDMKKYNFASSHKSFCVNLYNVKNIRGYDIYMTNGTIVPLSQKKSTSFREELNTYLSDRILNVTRG